jgi:hypothetical protein
MAIVMQAMSVRQFANCTAIHVQLKPSPNHGNILISYLPPTRICR